MGIVVMGAVFVDIKGYPDGIYIPAGRNAGRVEQIYGGVSRNVTEDIANCELRPTFISLVDDTAIGADVIRQLQNHKVNTRFVRQVPDGMGTWLAVFDNEGDVVASISKRPNLMPILETLEEHGDEIFSQADSIVIEVDMDKAIVKKTLVLAKKYNKPVYGVVANMSIGLERRDFLKELSAFVCNIQEAGLLFCTDFSENTPEELVDMISQRVIQARIPKLVVTLGSQGAIYADMAGDKGLCPARAVEVKDTTGAGDSFCAGLTVGLTYGKSLRQACEIGTHLAASVIVTTENVCPRFLPRELGIDLDVLD
ncbi:MAG: PfkB family carbohydrate kinase [Candidatus Faecousia sp.]|nr:PfkB family carbohydrate kinase [Candidatus Faecousia sp.]